LTLDGRFCEGLMIACNKSRGLIKITPHFVEMTCSPISPAFLTSSFGTAFILGRLPKVEFCWRSQGALQTLRPWADRFRSSPWSCCLCCDAA